MAALGYATTSTHYLGKVSLVLPIMIIRTVPGALPMGISVSRTRTLDLTQRQALDVKMARIRTTVQVNKVTASIYLPVILTRNASSSPKLVVTTHTGNVNVIKDTAGMEFSARMEMEL